MGHKAAHEYALPKPGRIPREEAWEQVLREHQGLVVKLTRQLAMRLTNGNTTGFLGMNATELYDELIGAAQEVALIAVEGRRTAKITTYITRIFWRRMQRVVDNLVKERGPNTFSGDELGWEALENQHYIHTTGRRLRVGSGTTEAEAPHGYRPTHAVLIESLAASPDLEREPKYGLSERSAEVLAQYMTGQWVGAADWLDACEDAGLASLSPSGRGAYNRFLRSKELT